MRSLSSDFLAQLGGRSFIVFNITSANHPAAIINILELKDLSRNTQIYYLSNNQCLQSKLRNMKPG